MATFNVTAAWDKPAYTAGEQMTATITGDYSGTTTSTATVGPVTIPVVANSGAQSTVSVPAVQVTTTATVSEVVLIDTARPVVDPSGRTWVVSADRKSIKATA